MASPLGTTIYAGELASIPVRLHVLLPAALVVSLLNNLKASWAVLAFIAVLYGPILWLTVLLHELGHCLATKRLGSEVHGILLWPLGGLAFMGKSSSPQKDLIVAVAGPLTHIPQVAFWAGLFLLAGGGKNGGFMAELLAGLDPNRHFFTSVCAGAAQMNIWLMVFNLLLPAYPLDGGRIFADTLLMAGVAVDVAARVVVGVAAAIAIGIISYGLFAAHVLTMAVGAWMLWSTWPLVVAIRVGSVHDHPLFSYEDAEGASEALFPKIDSGATSEV